MPAPQVVLVSNGPGEVTNWVRPTLRAWRRLDGDARVAIALIPCQHASGGEAAVAERFGADALTTPGAFVRATALGRAPEGLVDEARDGPRVVVSMGGNGALAVRLGRALRARVVRYSYLPYRPRGIDKLFVHDERTLTKARRLGSTAQQVEAIGNLVADALETVPPAADVGTPHVLLFAGSRDAYAIHLIPFLLALADELRLRYPNARFVWPVSSLLSPEAIATGIAGRHVEDFGGVAGERISAIGERRGVVRAPGGALVHMVDEHERPAHLRAATIAITIPGTNTLELGVAGVPSVVMLPLNRPEVIPLDGPGHWLSLLPLVGVPLKRWAVRLFVERLDYPVALPNQLSGEMLMREVSGRISVQRVASEAATLLDDEAERARITRRLQATMPRAGAAERLVRRVYDHLGLSLTAAP